MGEARRHFQETSVKSEAVALRIGQSIRAARRQRGVSQEQLAKGSGMHRTAIGLLERGRRTPRAETMFKIAVALELDSPAPLFDGLEWTPDHHGGGMWSIDWTHRPPGAGRAS